MAEPQATTPSEKPRSRNETQSTSAEPRSFREAELLRSDGSPSALAGPAVEAGRRFAETGRYAGRQISEAWRLALDPLLAMQYDMSRMFDDVWRQTFGFRQPHAAHPLQTLGFLTTPGLFGQPPADLSETKDAHELDIELPGLAAKDIDISVEGDSLIVCGQKAQTSTEATAAYHLSERRYGRFERVFPLPPDINRDKIAAQFRDGVLKITLPKAPEVATPRKKIEVRA
jgi:HSP20 family protein